MKILRIVNYYAEKYMQISCVYGTQLIYSIVQIFSIYDVNLKDKILDVRC